MSPRVNTCNVILVTNIAPQLYKCICEVSSNQFEDKIIELDKFCPKYKINVEDNIHHYTTFKT